MANLNFIKKALPWIGTALQVALPGPLGNLASILTKQLGKQVGADPATLATEVETALMDPATAEKMREADNELKLELQKLNFQNAVDLENLAVQDRDSARKREIAVRDRTPQFIATAVMVMAFFVLVMILFGRVDKELSDNTSSLTIGTVIGYVFSEVKEVVSYYLGSSASAVTKDKIISDIAKAN